MPKFRGDGHRARFFDAVSDLRWVEHVPADWAACLFILTADEWIWKAVAPHVNLRLHEIDWTKIRRIHTGHGHGFLLNLAQYLYNDSGNLDLSCLWETLDDRNFDLAMAALQIRRHGARVIERGKEVR